VLEPGEPLDELESIAEDHPLKKDRLEALEMLDKDGSGDSEFDLEE
jgi:hypothetical protein